MEFFCLFSVFNIALNPIDMTFELLIYFLPPVSFIIFGSGVVAGYLLSSYRKQEQEDLKYAYDELNNILIEKEEEIERLQNKLTQLLDGTTAQKPDNFTKIEGIGPKIEELLKSNGIKSFKDLATASVEKLTSILESAGPAYKRHNPDTWPGQANLAAKGDWQALKNWQESK